MPLIPDMDENFLFSDEHFAAQHFDLGGARLPDVGISQEIYGKEAQTLQNPPPAAAGFLHGELAISKTAEGAGYFLNPEDAPDHSKFEEWIPLLIRPNLPCDNCQARHLECYMRRGAPICNSCDSLSFECSLSKTHTFDDDACIDKNSGTFIDTDHVVDKDNCREQHTVTGIKPLRSGCSYRGTVTPRVPLDDALSSSKRNGIRFPRQAVLVLRGWLDAHQDHPYPTEEEKSDLESRTELKPAQIANWLANARRRGKAVRSRPKRCMSPSLGPRTSAISIQDVERGKPWDELNPLERWENSPPEHEPASVSAIASAVAHSDLPDGQDSTSSSSWGGRHHGSSNGSGFSIFKAPSTTSLEIGQSSSLSAESSAAFSHESSRSQGSLGSLGSFHASLAGKKDRRRRRRPAPTPYRKLTDRKLTDDMKRMFQCTFCTDTFKSKYDWTRHEKSLHLSLEKWICAPLGSYTIDSTTGKKRCVYCGVLDLNDDHADPHNHHQCEHKGLDSRTFYRKDHLRQHLRLMHGCGMIPEMDGWKSVAASINSRCGLCSERFGLWSERVDHLTNHFKCGATMKEWKGCRGLDPAVAAQVTNAMPPYLIGIESVSPNPFSATNRCSCNAFNQESDDSPVSDFDTSSNLVAAKQLDRLLTSTAVRDTHHQYYNAYGTPATCWEMLTVRLGTFANQQAERGTVLTDQMLQRQARRILYDSDDSWDHTAADNAEWLNLFKQAYGLEYIPSQIGGTARGVPEDLETYGDLGLRIPYGVRLEQGKTFAQESYEVPEVYTRLISERRKQAFGRFDQQLSQEGVLHTDDDHCGHAECMCNIVDATDVAGGSSTSPKHRRWCSYELQSAKAQELSKFTKDASSCAGAAPEMVPGGTDTRFKQAKALGFTTPFQLVSRMEPSGNSGHRSSQSRLEAAGSRVGYIHAPANLEPAEVGNSAGSTPYKEKAYRRRHQLEIPPDRARFATTTTAWPDSGIPGEQVVNPLSLGMLDSAMNGLTASFSSNTTSHTSPAFEAGQAVSTGNMMEFLGNNLGLDLPFSTDLNTPDLTTGSVYCTREGMFVYPTAQAASTFQGTVENGLSATESTAAQSMFDAVAHTTTEGMEMPNFSMDMDLSDVDFDGMFDMPVDDHFGNVTMDRLTQ